MGDAEVEEEDEGGVRKEDGVFGRRKKGKTWRRQENRREERKKRETWRKKDARTRRRKKGDVI